MTEKKKYCKRALKYIICKVNLSKKEATICAYQVFIRVKSGEREKETEERGNMW